MELNIYKYVIYYGPSSCNYDREVLIVLRWTIEEKSDKNFKKLYIQPLNSPFSIDYREIKIQEQ